MPFAAADRPSLAAGLLHAALRRDGIDCDAKYFNLTFWRLLGPEVYLSLAQGSAIAPLAGEWVFSQVFYGPEQHSTWESYQRQVLDHPLWGMDDKDRPAIRTALAAAPAFLRLVFESNDWSRYDLVGFTSTFEQTMASLCLAREIRQAHPGVRIVLGGANFEAGMGRPYLDHFDFVDFVSTGEADVSFPALCRRLRDFDAGKSTRLEVPPGFLSRNSGGPPEAGADGGATNGFVDLERLPTPDYDDYFRVARACTRGRPPRADEPSRPWLTVETSRGCWWGQKAHCTFCGLNGETLAYRQKSWRRVVAETDELAARHGNLPLQFTDNILATGSFRDLLPFWAKRRPPALKFFEIKANLRRRQVELLRDAGIRYVQPGIESLADDTLRLMHKGVSAAQNVALLRWCVEIGVASSWNLLYGFPQESLDDYRQNLAILRRLTHLPAPKGYGPIRLDRFSPNFERWRELGFTAVEPLPAYRHVYPFAAEALGELAYFFHYRHPQLEAALEAGVELGDFCHQWQERCQQGKNGELAVKRHWQGGHVLVDSRYNFERRAWRLSAPELALLSACDAPTSRRTALSSIAAAAGGTLAGGPLEAVLDKLVERSVIAELGNRLVSLAVWADRPESPSTQESRGSRPQGAAEPASPDN